MNRRSDLDPFTALCLAVLTIAVPGALGSVVVRNVLTTEYCIEPPRRR